MTKFYKPNDIATIYRVTNHNKTRYVEEKDYKKLQARVQELEAENKRLQKSVKYWKGNPSFYKANVVEEMKNSTKITILPDGSFAYREKDIDEHIAKLREAKNG